MRLPSSRHKTQAFFGLQGIPNPFWILDGIKDDGTGDTRSNELAAARVLSVKSAAKPAEAKSKQACRLCPRPAARCSRFCWHKDCPGCWAWCDHCEAALALPDYPVCGPCAIELAREPKRPLRRIRQPAPQTRGKIGGGTVERKGQKFRARVGKGQGRGTHLTLGYFATEAEARAAVAEHQGRRAA